MPTQQETTLQAGLSLRRAATVGATSGCPCPTTSKGVFKDQDFSLRPFVNMTLVETQFLRCKLDRANFTKSVLAFDTFTNCNAANLGIVMTQATLTSTTFQQCDLQETVWLNAWLDTISFLACNLKKSNFFGATLRLVTALNATILSDIVCVKSTLLQNTWIGIDFGRATFDHATIKDSVFSQSVLDDATFQSATLMTVDLTGCELEGTDFHKASLINCTLSGALAIGANFSEATLRFARVDNKTSFKEADFLGAFLQKTTFQGCSMVQAAFDRATLDDVTFVGTADLSKSSFHGATLDHVTVDGTTILSGVSFANSRMDYLVAKQTNLNGVIFDGCTVANADFSAASLITASFMNTIMTDATLDGSTLSLEVAGQGDDAKSAAIFENAKLTRLSMSTGSARFVVFTECDVTQSTFKEVNMGECNFDGSTVSDTTFEDCNLTYASFFGTKFIRVHFARCQLSQANTSKSLLESCTSDDSLLPDGWYRDENEWLAVVEDEPTTTILAIDQGNTFRVVDTVLEDSAQGVLTVRWGDNYSTSVGPTDIYKLTKTTPLKWLVGSPVFVQLYPDMKYVYAQIRKWDKTTDTLDLSFYRHVPVPANVSEKQNTASVFLEYFDKQEIKIGLFTTFFRSIQTILEEVSENTYDVIWYDNTEAETDFLININPVQPQTLNVGEIVMFKMVATNSSSFQDNHYLLAKVDESHQNGYYKLVFDSRTPRPNSLVSIVDLFSLKDVVEFRER